MNGSSSTVSIDQLVSRIVRLQDPESDYLFTGDPASFDVADLEFMQSDVERRIFLAHKRKSAPGEVDKLVEEQSDISRLIDFATQLKSYLIGVAVADFKGKSDSILVFDHSIDPGDIFQHPDSRIVKYSALQFAKERYGIAITDWDLPAPTGSTHTPSTSQQTPTGQQPIPSARSEQSQVVSEVQSNESQTLLLTLSWFLDIYLKKKHFNWKEIHQDPNLKISSSVFNAGQLNIDAISKSIAGEIDMPGNIARGLRPYVEIARDFNLDQGTIQAPFSPGQVKGAYRALYGLVRLKLRTILADDQKFARLKDRPEEVASIITGKSAPPEPLSKHEVTGCLSKCWDIVTQMILDKSSPPKRSPL